jgi:hypothetical protein
VRFCLLAASLSLNFAITRWWSVSHSIHVNNWISGTLEWFLLSIKIWSVWLWFFPSGDVQVNLWMLPCGNIVLLTVRFLDVAKFSTPLSLQISCELSFPIVGLKLSSLPILILKSHNKIFIWYLGNLLNTRSCSS